MSEEQLERFSAIIANAPTRPDLMPTVGRAPKMAPNRARTLSAVPASERISDAKLKPDFPAKVMEGAMALNILEPLVRRGAIINGTLSVQAQRPSVRQIVDPKSPILPKNTFASQLSSGFDSDKQEKFESGETEGSMSGQRSFRKQTNSSAKVS